MFSWPSGAKVSSSRAPPPKVTATGLRFLGAEKPRNAAGPKKNAAAAAPQAVRRKFRRLREIARDISWEGRPRTATGRICRQTLRARRYCEGEEERYDDLQMYTQMYTAMLRLGAGILLAWQEPTIRVDVQQVLVPVVVTDKKGHHVSGLRATDFRIFEDGVQQDIASVATEKAGSVDDVGALSKSQQTGPRHTFVICIDTLHIAPSAAARVRQTLESLFESEKPAAAQFALIGIGRQLQVLQTATANPLEALVKIRGAAWQNAMGGSSAGALAAGVQNVRQRMEEFCGRCGCSARSGQQNCGAEIDTLKQSVDGDAERWTPPLNALAEQFRSVVQELGKLPTGRTLILVSDGFTLDAKREFYPAVWAYLPGSPQFKLDDSSSAVPAFQQALKIAAERNVTIYTVDSRGAASAVAGGESMDASAAAPARSGSVLDGIGARSTRLESLPNSSVPALAKSVTMEQLAHSTGGVYYHDSRDMLKQFQGALADGREYYMLAYAPKNGARDGRYRTIAVDTAGKKLNVRAKPGYWAPGEAQ